jgi:hypothetical protein
MGRVPRVPRVQISWGDLGDMFFGYLMNSDHDSYDGILLHHGNLDKTHVEY